MVSNKAKGNNFENMCKKKLEAEGYVVMKSPRSMKMIFTPKGKMFISQANDYFGLYDLCAKKNFITRWIQCKYGSKSNVSTAKKPMQLFHDKYMSESETSEIWFKEEGSKNLDIYQYDKLTQEYNKT